MSPTDPSRYFATNASGPVPDGGWCPDDGYSRLRYLAAKRTVDDRALNRAVLAEVTPVLETAQTIVEVGAGIGTMVQRLLEWDLLGADVTYVMVDTDDDAVGTAMDRLSAWRHTTGGSVDPSGTGPTETVGLEPPEEAFTLSTERRTVRIEGVVDDATSALADRSPDVLIGCAFVDLLTPKAVEAFLERVPRDVVCYFPITFDGGTTFRPTVGELDDLIADRYHEDMKRRQNPGDPHAGRHLVERAVADGSLLAAGGSDWVVAPKTEDSDGPEGGGYPTDERYFLHHIVDTVSRAVADDHMIDEERLSEWTTSRHLAIENGALTYIAHQLDVALRT